jgi:hypothetical protein
VRLEPEGHAVGVVAGGDLVVGYLSSRDCQLKSETKHYRGFARRSKALGYPTQIGTILTKIG